MEHCKLQIGCLSVLIYIGFVYWRELKMTGAKIKDAFFGRLLILGMVSILLDGATAYTVNYLSADSMVNTVLHGLFLSSLDSVIFALFLYMLRITGVYPKKKLGKALVFLPFIINIFIVVLNISSLRYIQGKVTNYSMGISAYTCFVMAAIYTIMSIVVFFGRLKYIENHKKTTLFTYLSAVIVITGIQMIFPETLISSIAVMILVLGIYMNSENPTLKELMRFHSETVISFATLVENRDNSTGGHIKRTSRYVELIAEELRNRGYYGDIITKDYITNLVKAAPMHDIGKISVPDSVLQKPGRLTAEEFEIMKLHAENGGNIIRETFRNLGDEGFRKMAFQVARYHHEKWNGKGYPDGLAREEIPLCARIMAVSDVFDAVSEKRCYRDAMPIDKCFEIIAEGAGRDFDPDIAQLFLDIRDKVENAHKELNM